MSKSLEHLKKYNLDSKVIFFDVSSATVSLASLALGTTEGHIAKSLTFMVQNKPIMIVTSGDVKIDNAKYKAYFKEKARMIERNRLPKLVGLEAGGICPFGINAEVKVYLDISLKNYDIVYPAAGTDNSAVKLTIEELERASGYIEWIDVTKIKDEL